jgi:hypothetical protein
VGAGPRTLSLATTSTIAWSGLQEEERKIIAARAVEYIKRNGDPWKLDQDMPPTIGAGHGERAGELD